MTERALPAHQCLEGQSSPASERTAGSWLLPGDHLTHLLLTSSPAARYAELIHNARPRVDKSRCEDMAPSNLIYKEKKHREGQLLPCLFLAAAGCNLIFVHHVGCSSKCWTCRSARYCCQDLAHVSFTCSNIAAFASP